MGHTNNLKATLCFTDGEQIMARFDIEHINIEAESVTQNACDEVNVTMEGTARAELLHFIWRMKRPDTFEMRAPHQYKWVNPKHLIPEPSRVIFNDPATIVFWKDGTKTVAKAQAGDLFDKKRGIVVCMLKKLFGGGNAYNKLINSMEKEAEKWVDKTNA